MPLNNAITTTRRHLAVALFATVSLVMACQPGPDSNGKAPVAPATPQKKPTRVALTQVSLSTLNELGRLDRALRPILGLQGSSADTVIEKGCRVTEEGQTELWRTKWKCGLDSTERAKKEIEGVENVDYDRDVRKISYLGSFEIRNYDDNEARSKAHTLAVSRRITILLEPGFTKTDVVGKFKITTSAMKKNISASALGSDWKTIITGDIRAVSGKWTASNVKSDFNGSLYGLDGERLTAWASGKFLIDSESNVELLGLGDGGCTTPAGTWKLEGKGEGEVLQSSLVTNNAGGVEASGGLFQWPILRCEQP